MRAYKAWHTAMCPELSIETIRLSTLILLLSQSRQADPSIPPVLHCTTDLEAEPAACGKTGRAGCGLVLVTHLHGQKNL